MHIPAHLERHSERYRGLYSNGATKHGADHDVVNAGKEPLFGSDANRDLQETPKALEITETQITLNQLPVGSRLLVRSRVDWRFASVSRIADGRIVITVCSPTGRTYRLNREFDTAVAIDGSIPVLVNEGSEDWRDNFSRYDFRW